MRISAHKARLVAVGEEDTVRTILFAQGWHHAPQHIADVFVKKEWIDREKETQDSRPDEPVIGRTIIAGDEVPIQRFASLGPASAPEAGRPQTQGDCMRMAPVTLLFEEDS